MEYAPQGATEPVQVKARWEPLVDLDLFGVVQKQPGKKKALLDHWICHREIAVEPIPGMQRAALGELPVYPYPDHPPHRRPPRVRVPLVLAHAHEVEEGEPVGSVGRARSWLKEPPLAYPAEYTLSSSNSRRSPNRASTSSVNPTSSAVEGAPVVIHM